MGESPEYRDGEGKTTVIERVQQDAGEVKIGAWVIVKLLSVLPVINIIMLLVWAFGGGAKPSLANWAKATLIWAVFGIILSVLFWSGIIGLITGLANALK